MKEALLDVLMYLFEHYVETPQQTVNEQLITGEMLRAGFQADDIDRAIHWLEGLNSLRHDMENVRSPSLKSFRVFSTHELERISKAALDYLLLLEEAEVIDPAARELIVNRALALDARAIDLPTMKWTMLMVLWNKPALQDRLNLMEELVFSSNETKH